MQTIAALLVAISTIQSTAATWKEEAESVGQAMAACRQAGKGVLTRARSEAEEQKVETACRPAFDRWKKVAEAFPGRIETALLMLEVRSVVDGLDAADKWFSVPVRAKHCPLMEKHFRDRFLRNENDKDIGFSAFCEKEAARAYVKKIAGEKSTIGTYVSSEYGDYPHLNIKDEKGKERSFWCLQGCAPFDGGETVKALVGKKVKVFWVHRKEPLPEAGDTIAMDVVTRVELLK